MWISVRGGLLNIRGRKLGTAGGDIGVVSLLAVVSPEDLGCRFSMWRILCLSHLCGMGKLCRLNRNFESSKIMKLNTCGTRVANRVIFSFLSFVDRSTWWIVCPAIGRSYNRRIPM